MIYIDRNREKDGQSIRPSAAWFTRAEALQQQAMNEGGAHEVTDHYKHPQVKMALEELFHHKCAYCETPLGVGGSWDVEHYRPKGAVAEQPNDHPGYYWLAYDWENLLPACEFCNQRRKDPPLFGDPQELPAQGKLDQFPVEDESSRAMAPNDDLGQEQPLLLNPTIKDPELHLTYDVQGQIHPLSIDDRRAKETIRICHLRRRRLRMARAEIIVQVSKAMRNLLLARKAGNALAETMMAETIEMFFVADNHRYAGAARAVKRDPAAFAAESPGG